MYNYRADFLLNITHRDEYTLHCLAPLYANVLKNEYGLEVFPVDQSGGLRNGDVQHMKYILQEDTSLWIQPPSSTVFFAGFESDAIHTKAQKPIHTQSSLNIVLEKNTRAYMLAMPLVLCADSHVMQSTHIVCEKGSQGIFFEIWLLGRIYHQEQWQFHRLHNEYTFSYDKEEILHERWILDPLSQYSKKGTGTLQSDSMAGLSYNTLWYSIIGVGAQECSILQELLMQRGDICECGYLKEDIILLRGMTKDISYFCGGLQKDIATRTKHIAQEQYNM